MEQPLAVSSLRKRFDSLTAVEDVSFSVASGEVLGIVGPNGAGKTTTVKAVLGLLQPDGGNVTLFGRKPDDTEVRRLVGYMPEGPSFYHYLTGRELLMLVAALFNLPKAEARKRTDELLERVGLADAGTRRLGTYSKGMLQRVCLAQALINRPRLLFLDEPLDGLDPIGRVRMKEILLEIKGAGTAIVLNSHILGDVEVLSDRIAIMDRGRIVAEGPVAELIPAGRTLEDVFIETVEGAA